MYLSLLAPDNVDDFFHHSSICTTTATAVQPPSVSDRAVFMVSSACVIAAIVGHLRVGNGILTTATGMVQTAEFIAYDSFVQVMARGRWDSRRHMTYIFVFKDGLDPPPPPSLPYTEVIYILGWLSNTNLSYRSAAVSAGVLPIIAGWLPYLTLARNMSMVSIS